MSHPANSSKGRGVEESGVFLQTVVYEPVGLGKEEEEDREERDNLEAHDAEDDDGGKDRGSAICEGHNTGIPGVGGMEEE